MPVSSYGHRMESGHDELLTIPEAIEKLRISRTHFFRLKRQGVIVGMRLGHRTLIPSREIARLIDERYHPPKSDG
ncbi:DNA-binding protein [Mycobacteroides abscessus]|nr:DNA-binding protein [Mycobacteroides abscessus]